MLTEYHLNCMETLRKMREVFLKNFIPSQDYFYHTKQYKTQ